MDRKEKNARKAKLSEHVNLSNGRFKDHEIEELEALVENRDNLDRTKKTYRSCYKTFDSKDTYRVVEEDTYTFCNDNGRIYIERNLKMHYDDEQINVYPEKYDTARDILSHVPKLFGKSDEK